MCCNTLQHAATHCTKTACSTGMNTYVYPCTYVYAWRNTCVCMHVCIHKYIHVYVYIRACICVNRILVCFWYVYVWLHIYRHQYCCFPTSVYEYFRQLVETQLNLQIEFAVCCSVLKTHILVPFGKRLKETEKKKEIFPAIGGKSIEFTRRWCMKHMWRAATYCHLLQHNVTTYCNTM